METPLTPLEFARRARRLFGQREAVVDGSLRFTYEQFFDRCDRWSAVLQRLGVKPGDRVAYIAPNIHAQLESFYAVPQIGAVLALRGGAPAPGCAWFSARRHRQPVSRLTATASACQWPPAPPTRTDRG